MAADIRTGLRALWRERRLSAAIIGILSLGIGAATTAFTLTNWIFLRPLPGVVDPGRAGLLSFITRQRQTDMTTLIDGPLRADILRAAPGLHALAAFNALTLTAASPMRSARADAQFVTPEYFSVLGTRPYFGRLLLPDDNTAPKGLPVAVISHDLWRSLFQADSMVIGQELRLNATSVTVVGVAEPGFRGHDRNGTIDIWLPLWRYTSVVQVAFNWQATTSLLLVRLRPGASFDDIDQQLRTSSVAGAGHTPRIVRGLGVRGVARGSAVQVARLSAGLTGALLLVACANAAHVLILRGLTHRTRTALRVVVGATPGSLIRAHLAEALIIGTAAALGGAILAFVILRALDGSTFGSSIVRSAAIPIDARVLAFCVTVALTGAVAAVLAPAWLAIRTPAQAAIRDTGRSATSSTPHVRRVLTAVQVALSLSLLAGAFLFIRTLRNLHRVELGFSPDGLSLFTVAPRERDASQPWLMEYQRTLIRALRDIPGVDAVSVSNTAPFPGGYTLLHVAENRVTDFETQGLAVVGNRISQDYFKALRIPLLAGREFNEHEVLRPTTDPARVVILNATLATKLFGSIPLALGQYVWIRSADTLPNEVVGIVGDMRWTTLTAVPEREGPMLFGPYGGVSMGWSTLMLRSDRPLSALTPLVRQAALSVDAAVPAFDPTTMHERIGRTLAERRFLARSFGFLSAAALLITTAGLYCTIAFDVERRRREFGIRLALGAGARHIVRQVTGHAIVVTALGITGGLFGALLVGRHIQSRLYGVSPVDSLSLGLAAGAILAAGIAAASVPSWKAVKVEPAVTLRAE